MILPFPFVMPSLEAARVHRANAEEFYEFCRSSYDHRDKLSAGLYHAARERLFAAQDLYWEAWRRERQVRHG